MHLIYVVIRGKHSFLIEELKKGQYKEWNYCDKQWSVDKKRGFIGIVRTLFLPTRSAISSIKYSGSIWKRSRRMRIRTYKFTLANSDFKKLLTYLKNQKAKPLAKMPGWYEGQKSYNLFHNCHHFVLAAIKSAGVSVSSHKILSSPVMSYELNRVIRKEKMNRLQARDNILNLTRLASRPQYVENLASRLHFKIALETIKQRGFVGVLKYGIYFTTFWIYGLLDFNRSKIIKSGYFWLRHIDDIADQDKQLPSRYKSRSAFLRQKMDIVKKLSKNILVTGDKEDVLLVDYLLRSKKLGIDLTQESIAIIKTMMIDEERSRNRRILTQSELDDYFRKLDFACVDGALKVAGDSWAAQYLQDLSYAVRTRFNLHDFQSDLGKGIINISQEDIENYRIDLSRCKAKNTRELLEYAPIRNWYKDQVETGSNFLQSAQATLQKIPLKWQTQLALSVNFVRPSSITFKHYQKILQS